MSDKPDAGEDDADGISLPGCLLVGVGETTPEIDGDLSLVINADGGTHLAAFGEVALEGLANEIEFGLTESLNAHPGLPVRIGQISW